MSRTCTDIPIEIEGWNDFTVYNHNPMNTVATHCYHRTRSKRLTVSPITRRDVTRSSKFPISQKWYEDRVNFQRSDINLVLLYTKPNANLRQPRCWFPLMQSIILRTGRKKATRFDLNPNRRLIDDNIYIYRARLDVLSFSRAWKTCQILEKLR